MHRLVLALAVTGLAFAGLSPAHAVEGCVTSNPGPGTDPVAVAKCSYVAATVGSIGATGSWKVTVTTPPPKPKPGQKKGKPTVKVYEGNSPAPVTHMDVIRPGDSVSVEALTPGTLCAAGNAAP
ncbi:MAG TPA: hypothetical protein VNA14_06355 [Mycobacteriales bacterium]|nr:hypothetical protein [Mycobacteriales bacterium]